MKIKNEKGSECILTATVGLTEVLPLMVTPEPPPELPELELELLGKSEYFLYPVSKTENVSSSLEDLNKCLTVIALVSAMGCTIQSNHSVPSVIIQGPRKSIIVRGEIKRLSDIRKPIPRTRIVRLGVQLQDLLNHIVRDGREECPKLAADIGRSIDAGRRRTVVLVLLVADH